MLPYPNYPTSYTKIEKVGGYDRTCYVLELFTLGAMDPIRRANMEDAIQMTINRFKEVEKHEIIKSDRFDHVLRKAMRI